MIEARRSTEVLLERAAGGDAIARRELLDRHRLDLRRMVAARLDRRLAPRVDPSDLVQETLAEAAAKLDDYLQRPPIPFHGWLRQIAAERVIQAHRRHVGSQRRSVARERHDGGLPEDSAVALVDLLVAQDTSPSNRLVREERIERVMAALDALPARDREVLVMRHLEQLGTPAIAEALGINEPAVRARLVRALARLRAQLEESEP